MPRNLRIMLTVYLYFLHRCFLRVFCTVIGCNSEDLPEAMNDREKWREMVKDIRAGGTT